MDRTLGVDDPPDTVSHGADAAVENAILWETTLEVIPTTVGEGTAEAPDAIEKGTLEDASTISMDAGRMLRLTPSSPAAGGVAESAAVSVKLKSPAVVGEPLIWPFDIVRPGGSEPVTAKEYGCRPPVAMRSCTG